MLHCITHEETHLSLLAGTPGASLIAGLPEPEVAGYSFSTHLPQAGFLSSNPPQTRVSNIIPKGVPPLRDKPRVCVPWECEYTSLPEATGSLPKSTVKLSSSTLSLKKIHIKFINQEKKGKHQLEEARTDIRRWGWQNLRVK